MFIDTEESSWNMDTISSICEKYGVLLIEDATEAMGATIRGGPWVFFVIILQLVTTVTRSSQVLLAAWLLANDIEVAKKLVSGKHKQE